MSKQRFSERRQAHRAWARSRDYLLGKQAGAVEAVLRQRGVLAQAQPTRHGGNVLAQVGDAAAHLGYLDEHAAALADALGVDAVAIISGSRTFIVAPAWRLPPGRRAAAEQTAGGPAATTAARPCAGRPTEPPPAVAAPWDAGSRRPGATQPLSPHPPVARPQWADRVARLQAFSHGYKMGRLAGVLGELRRNLALGEPRSDGSFELRLAAGCDDVAVRALLQRRSAAIAEALGAAACRIGGVGRRITITPCPPPPPRAAQGAWRR